MPNPIYPYAWAVGHDVPLENLILFEEDLYAITKPRRLAPTSQPLELFPIRVATLDGVERGEGNLTCVWEIRALPWAAYLHILDTKFTVSGTNIVSRPMTLYTRNDRMSFARYNATALRPLRGQQYSYRRQYVVDLLLRFNDLVELAEP